MNRLSAAIFFGMLGLVIGTIGGNALTNSESFASQVENLEVGDELDEDFIKSLNVELPEGQSIAEVKNEDETITLYVISCDQAHGEQGYVILNLECDRYPHTREIRLVNPLDDTVDHYGVSSAITFVVPAGSNDTVTAYPSYRAGVPVSVQFEVVSNGEVFIYTASRNDDGWINFS